MENNLQKIVADKNAMVKQGQVVEATDKFFAENAKTIDYTGAKTNNKAEMLEKMRGFVGGIKAVNGITLHHEALNGNVSFAEFTFDFDMQDGSKIYWHEILRTVWQDGMIIEEQYFSS
jgi:Cu/Ag efflux protein CusF